MIRNNPAYPPGVWRAVHYIFNNFDILTREQAAEIIAEETAPERIHSKEELPV